MKNMIEEQKINIALRYRELDETQKKIVMWKNQNLLIAAGPGAGKTRVIVNRIDYLVNYEGVAPGNIIVITFTKAAAANMKKRYMDLNSRKVTPFFGTFHGLFYKILKNAYKEIQIISSTEAYRLINNVLLTYLDEVSEEKVKEVLNGISLFKSSDVSMEAFQTSIEKDIFIKCFSTYEEYKQEKVLMDFDDLQIQCKKLFLQNPVLLEQYRKAFKYILVDEFQDCDVLQIQLLKLLNKNNFIFAVGDEDQCIYGFRGSKPDCMVQFEKHFLNSERIFLSTNYRSTENIVRLSMELIQNNKMRTQKKIEAYRKERKEIKVIYNFNEGLQAEGIAVHILKENQERGIDFNQHAVLYRTNMESRSIIDGFIRKRVPFKLLDKEYNFFEHFICKDILAYLKLSIDPTDRESFIRVINKPFRYVSKLNLNKVKEHVIVEDCFDILLSIEDIPFFQVRSLQKVKKDIHNLNKITLRSAIEFIILDIGYHEYLMEYGKKFKMGITELEEIMEEFKASAQNFNTIIEFLVHVSNVEEIMKESAEKEKDGVLLSTIHGVKGMEFPNVYIINCNEEHIPHINSVEENLEEERRLFYVAITRAIDHLWICQCKNIRGKVVESSRFIEECNPKEVLNIEMGFVQGEDILHKNYGEGKIIYIDEKEIEILFLDRISRRFNTEIVIQKGLIVKK